MIPYHPPRATRAIPVIDLTGAFSAELAQREAVAADIHKACRETGFFYVANHGVPRALIDSQFEWTRRFFDLPLAEKMAIHMKKSRTTAGYEPVGGQVLDSQDPH